MSRSADRHPLLLLAPALALAAAGASYLAEHQTVRRWSSRPDPQEGEPRTIGGTERWLTTADGASLRVVESNGGGSPVVLAHCFTGTADHWAPVAARLADRGLRVVAFDQRGHGRSTAGGAGFSPGRLGDDLDEVLAATAPEEAVVAGHSMGGIGLQAFVRDHPERAGKLRGVVLVATLGRMSRARLAPLAIGLSATAAARRAMAHPVHGRILARSSVGRRVSVTVLDVVRDGWSACPDATRAGVGRDLPGFDFRDVLSRFPVPATVVCGDLDRITPLAESKWIASRIPGGRLEVVPGAGHQVTWEAADLVAAAIADLASHTGDDP